MRDMLLVGENSDMAPVFLQHKIARLELDLEQTKEALALVESKEASVTETVSAPPKKAPVSKKAAPKVELPEPDADEDEPSELDEALGEDTGPSVDDLRKLCHGISQKKGEKGTARARDILKKYTIDKSDKCAKVPKEKISTVMSALAKI